MISKNQICGKIFNMTLIVLVFQAILISTSDARKGNQTLYDVSMFTDQKARQVGDLLTVIVVEKASASKEASTQTSRSSNRNGSLGGFVGINTRGLGKGIRLNSGSTFTGSGSTSRSETLNATVPVTVTEVLPNDNLKVEGQRQVTVNGEKQILNVKGVVRPRDIAPNNTIFSTNLANAEITYKGDGIVSRQQKPGLISRILDFIWIF